MCTDTAFRRLTRKVQAAAGLGLVGGGVYAVLKRGPVLRWGLATSVSCALCEGTFAGLQETARRLRRHDSPANSFIAGGFAGYMLSNLHFRSPQKAFQIAVVCASGAATLDVLNRWYDLAGAPRRTLIKLELLDDPLGSTEPRSGPSGSTEAEVAGRRPDIGVGEGMHYNQTGTWRDLLPFRKLSPEEWEAYQRKKHADFQAKIDRATKPPPGE